MTLPQALSFAVIGGMLVLFVLDRWCYDVVALLALLAAVACVVICGVPLIAMVWPLH